ncbi:MAG: hypothetical protein AAGH74_02580 [Pseudomonadota bacterium]
MTDINLNSSSYSTFAGDMVLQQAKSDLQALKQQSGNKELSGDGARLLAGKSKGKKTEGRQQAIRNLEALCVKAAGGNLKIEDALKKTLQTSIGQSAYSGDNGLKLDKASKVMDLLIAEYRSIKGASKTVNLGSVKPKNPKPIAKFENDIVHIKVSSNKGNQPQSMPPQQPQISPQMNDLMNTTLPPMPEVNTSLWDNSSNANPMGQSDLSNAKLPPQPKLNEDAWNSTAKGLEDNNQVGEPDEFEDLANVKLPPKPQLNEDAWNSTAKGPGDNNLLGEPDDLDGLANAKLPNKPEINKNIYQSTADYPSDISESSDDEFEIDENQSKVKVDAQPVMQPKKEHGVDAELEAESIPELPDGDSVIDDDSDAGLYDNDFHLDKDDEIDAPKFDKVKHALQMKADASTLSQLENTKTIPTVERPQLMIGMGQGAVGPLNQLQFYSDSFSSCSPLVLYNSQTGIGGLFHVPAPAVENWRDVETGNLLPDDQVKMTYAPGVAQSLKDMIELVKPDQMVLFAGSLGGSNEKNAIGFSGAPVSVRNHHIQLDLQKTVDAAGLNAKVQFVNKGTERLTVTATSNGKNLDINKTAIKSTKDVDLLDSEGVLPDGLKDKAVVRSNIQDDSDSAVLLDDSKFLANVKKKELLNNPNIQNIGNMIKSGTDLRWDVEEHTDYYKHMKQLDPEIDILKAAIDDLRRFEYAKNATPPQELLNRYNAASEKLQKFLKDNQ